MSYAIHCQICRGTGVVQLHYGHGYSGDCQRCSGEGTIYVVNGSEVSKDEYDYEQLDEIDY